MIMTLVSLTAALAALPPEEQLLARVQATYQAAADMEAKFSQTHVPKMRGKGKTEEGRLWAKKDGRLRWQYEKPTPKYFIHDGKRAYFYEPENAQVTVFEKFSDSQLYRALQFLLGRGDLREAFDVQACQKHCGLGEEGDRVVALWPKEPLAGVEHVLLFVEPAAARVRLSVVFDTLGNRQEYHFKDVSFDTNISEKKFTFKKPEGVQEIRAAMEGSRAPVSVKKEKQD